MPLGQTRHQFCFTENDKRSQTQSFPDLFRSSFLSCTEVRTYLQIHYTLIYILLYVNLSLDGADGALAIIRTSRAEVPAVPRDS